MPNPLMQMMGNAMGNNPMIQNNPIMKLVQVMKSGNGNPMQMVQQLATQNPQIKQILDMTNGKSRTEINQMINQMAQQKGINLSELATQIGMPEDIKKQYEID